MSLIGIKRVHFSMYKIHRHLKRNKMLTIKKNVVPYKADDEKNQH